MFVFWYFYQSSRNQISNRETCQTLMKTISENGRLTSEVNDMGKIFRLNSNSWQGCWKCRVSESNFYRAIHSAVACRVYVTRQHENFPCEKFMLHRYVNQRCIFVCAIDGISIQERNSPLRSCFPSPEPPLTFIAPSELHSHFLQDLDLHLFRAAPSSRETNETAIHLVNDSGFLELSFTQWPIA